MDKKHEIEETIAKLIKTELRLKNNITVDTNLGKLGFSSIDEIEIIIALEEKFKINITSDKDNIFDDILKQDTVHELADYIIKKLNKKK